MQTFCLAARKKQIEMRLAGVVELLAKSRRDGEEVVGETYLFSPVFRGNNITLMDEEVF